jgi:spore germination protein KC
MILSSALMMILLTGCFGSVEVDDWAYAYTVGLEKGVSDKMRFTIQIPTLKGGEGKSGGTQSDGDEYTYISIDAPSAFAGANMINTSLSRKVNFMHAKLFVVSEDLAREGIGEILNAFLRFGQIRRITQLVIVRESARDFIRDNKLIVGKSLPKIEEEIMNQEENTGFIDNISIGEFMAQTKLLTMQASAPLAMINDFSNQKDKGQSPSGFKTPGDYYAGELSRTGGDKTEYIGTAVFDGDKMVGELNGDETRMMLIASGEFQRAFIPIEDPLEKDKPETFDVRQQKVPDISISFNGDKPVINLKVFLEGDLIALRSKINYESTELKPVLEKAFEHYIKTELDKTIDKCKKLNCDIFAFGREAVRNFSTIQEWESYNWKSHFKDAKVKAEVQFIIRRTGTLIKTNPFRKAGGQK